MRRLRLCLCGSGGGHVRQLLELKSVWESRDYLFVTENLILGQSISKIHRTRFVRHVALGQAKLGAPFVMLWCALENMLESAKIVFQERPDVIITTGAGSMFFMTLWARIAGARVVVLDSFARFSGPSVFARIAGPLADVRISQSKEAGRKWGNAVAFDPLRRLDKAIPEKELILFATVGATLPFDRLIRMVEDAKHRNLIPEFVIAQIGSGGRSPVGFERVEEVIQFDEVKDILRRANIVVCHGGTGSLITALTEGCRVIAVPRLFEREEHYDNHQFEITSALAERRLISVAETQEEFDLALVKARAAEPVCMTTDPSELSNYLINLLEEWFPTIER